MLVLGQAERELLGANLTKGKVVGRYSKNKATAEGVLFIPFKSDDFGQISSHGQRACLHHANLLEPDL